jgi:VCBS repeat-containing protein
MTGRNRSEGVGSIWNLGCKGPYNRYGTKKASLSFLPHTISRRTAMSLFRSKRFSVVLAALMAFVLATGSQSTFAEDVAHAVSGVVKSVDKGTKTFVVKTADGTEHTIKWTDSTVVKGTKDTGKGIEKGSVDTYLGAKKGSQVTVDYTEKAGEKTATGVKDASKATAKAVTQ